MLKSHYEKFILLISALTALTFGLFLPMLSSMFSDGTAEEPLAKALEKVLFLGRTKRVCKLWSYPRKTV